jgi:kumamolisin
VKPISRTGHRRALIGLAAGTAGSLLLLSTGPAAAAAGPSGAPRVVVGQDTGAAVLKGAKVTGKAAAAGTERVSFVLRVTHPAALAARVNASGKALSVSQFAAGFGQPTSAINQLTSFLKANGITSAVDADHLDVQTTGTVADYNTALGITQAMFTTAARPAAAGRPAQPAVQFRATTQAATLPAPAAAIVLSVLGLSTYPAGFSNAVHEPRLKKGLQPRVTRTGNGTPASFESQYNLTPLLKAGHDGQGQTIGIITVASVRPSDPAHFWADVLKIKTKPGRLSLDNVDGGSGAVSEANGSAETTLDVEQSGALAPDANIVVYQAPNSDNGFLDAFATAASQDRASVVSDSWGASETEIAAGVAQQKESTTFAQAFDEMFLELAAQGQSTFVAAGDTGAYDAFAGLGTTNLAVDEPAASPWVTAVGGTTLNGTVAIAKGVSVTVAHQRAWGWDWLWPLWQDFGASSEQSFIQSGGVVAGGGGGYSTVEAAPGYQKRWLNPGKYTSVPYLTPSNFSSVDGLSLPTSWTFTQAPVATPGTSAGRAVPDLAADADPFTGYEEYFTSFTSGPALQAGWGGTSFAAPQLAGAAADINSMAGRRIGFWNPFIYHFAAEKGSPFTPLAAVGTSNDNLFFTGTKGDVYNPATGLGVPNLAALAARLKG